MQYRDNRHLLYMTSFATLKDTFVGTFTHLLTVFSKNIRSQINNHDNRDIFALQ